MFEFVHGAVDQIVQEALFAHLVVDVSFHRSVFLSIFDCFDTMMISKVPIVLCIQEDLTL